MFFRFLWLFDFVCISALKKYIYQQVCCYSHLLQIFISTIINKIMITPSIRNKKQNEIIFFLSIFLISFFGLLFSFLREKRGGGGDERLVSCAGKTVRRRRLAGQCGSSVQLVVAEHKIVAPVFFKRSHIETIVGTALLNARLYCVFSARHPTQKKKKKKKKLSINVSCQRKHINIYVPGEPQLQFFVIPPFALIQFCRSIQLQKKQNQAK